jgi:hypothetical protein
MLGVVAGQPLDTLRIRMQQAHCTHHNVVGMWRSMAKAEGVRGLFKGMSYPLYTTALQNAVTFQAQRAALRWLATSSSTNNNTSGSSNTTHAPHTDTADSSGSSGGGGSGGGGSSVTSWRHTGMAGMFAGGPLASCCSNMGAQQGLQHEGSSVLTQQPVMARISFTLVPRTVNGMHGEHHTVGPTPCL